MNGCKTRTTAIEKAKENGYKIHHKSYPINGTLSVQISIRKLGEDTPSSIRDHMDMAVKSCKR